MTWKKWKVGEEIRKNNSHHSIETFLSRIEMGMECTGEEIISSSSIELRD